MIHDLFSRHPVLIEFVFLVSPQHMIIIRDITPSIAQASIFKSSEQPCDSHPVRIFARRKDAFHALVYALNHDLGFSDVRIAPYR